MLNRHKSSWKQGDTVSRWQRSTTSYRAPFQSGRQTKSCQLTTADNKAPPTSKSNFSWVTDIVILQSCFSLLQSVSCKTWDLPAVKMRREVNRAVDFLGNFMRTRTNLAEQELQKFCHALHVLLCTHYKNHWFPEKPFKGSAYRCLRINHTMDPLIARAAAECGFSASNLASLFPNELTLWVDPYEVSYRIGEDGSIGVLFEETGDDNLQQTSNSPHQALPTEHCRYSVPGLGSDAINFEYLSQCVSSWFRLQHKC